MCVDYYVEEKKWVTIRKTKKEKKTEESCVNEFSNKKLAASFLPTNQSECVTVPPLAFHKVSETSCLIYFHPEILFIVLYIIICKEGFYLAVQHSPLQ